MSLLIPAELRKSPDAGPIKAEQIERTPVDEISEAQLDEWLNSGSERPVLVAARAQRFVWIAAAVALATWLLWARLQADWIDALLFASTLLLLGAAGLLRVLVRRLDRRAMAKDMVLLRPRATKEEQSATVEDTRP